MTASNRRFRRFHLLVLATLAGCWDIPGTDIELPIKITGGGSHHEGDEDEDGGDEPCGDEGGAFDCSLIQGCLDQLDDACADFDACYSLKPADVVCGDLTCNGPGELGPCGEICEAQNLCAATEACLDACADPCDLDCLWGCWDTSPDCLGTACVIELGCEECP